MSTIDPTELFEAINSQYNLSDIHTMCMRLQIDYENLAGSTRIDKARELVLYAQRRGRLQDVANYVANPPEDAFVPSVPTVAPTTIYNIDKVINSAVGDGAQQNIQQQVQGDLMSESKKQEIKIEGAVVGSAIGGGKVEATNIAGRDVNIGQAPQTRQEFVTQLAELQALIKSAVENGELNNARDAQSVVNDVDTAVTELQEPTPRVSRLKRALEGATEILTEAAQTAQAAGKAGLAILKAAPIARALLSVADTIF